MHDEQITCTFVIVDNRGAIVRRETFQAAQVVFNVGSGQELAMFSLPGGDYLMGSPPAEGYADERPQHQVTIRPFLIGRLPITQAQWTAVMAGDKPSRFSGPHKAVHNITWQEATAFCRRLTAVTGHPFRLPSEAQWEYACRGGTMTPFSSGPTITTDLANYNGEFSYLDAPRGPYRHVLLDAGSFAPNPFGLHDMHGNLWEWCADPWHDSYEGAPRDGRVWEAGGNERYRVVRGGSWHETPDLCRSAVRLKHSFSEGDETVGFRVVAEIQLR